MDKFIALAKGKFALPIVASIGLLITILIIKLQPSMQHTPSERPSVPVSYIEIAKHKIKPEIIGYGTVMPEVDLKRQKEQSR